MKKIEFINEPGWFGSFTRNQADGAIPNGTTIQKINSENGDTNTNGTLGVVLGSIDAEAIDPALAKKYHARYFYFIEWRTAPRCAAGVAGFKVARLA